MLLHRNVFGGPTDVSLSDSPGSIMHFGAFLESLLLAMQLGTDGGWLQQGGGIKKGMAWGSHEKKAYFRNQEHFFKKLRHF